jgi:sulfatase maturation enzyme AslB (radical SAM superfamily)
MLKQNPKSSSFCILPFIHISAAVSGHFRPCCNTTGKGSHFLFKDIDVSLKEAFYSKEMDELRTQLNTDERPTICNVCWKNEDIGIVSPRAKNNLKFKDKINTTTDAKLQFLDMKFDNKCNLQCRMCSPFSSDQIWKTIELFDEIPNHLSYVDMDKETYDKNNNSQARKRYVQESMQDITFLKVTGGEPFLSKDFIEILEEAVSEGHSKRITLSITTNGTKFTSKITNMFKHFKEVDINISIEGINELYDYIRYPYSYNRWKDRFITFIDNMKQLDHPKFKLRFSTIVTAYNYLSLTDLQKEIDIIKGNYKNMDITNSYEFDLKPEFSEMHAKYLPAHILTEGCRKVTGGPLAKIFKFAAYHSTNDTKREELVKTTLAFDKARNQSYSHSVHPLLTEWLNG